MIERHAILEGKKVVVIDTSTTEGLLKWAKWFDVENRHVAKDELDECIVSTVFLGLNHAFGSEYPLWFETMVFDKSGSYSDLYCERYKSWEQAEAGHRALVAQIRSEGIGCL